MDIAPFQQRLVLRAAHWLIAALSILVVCASSRAAGTGHATLAPADTPAAPQIVSSNNIGGQVGSPFSYQILATNNPTSYNATQLPPGLTINTSTGLISGTPTKSGTYAPTLSATNAGGTGYSYPSTYIAPPPPVITSPLTASGSVNAEFGYTITATDSPSSFSVSGLPPGLSWNGDGEITGIPTGTGVSNVTITADTGSGNVSATLVLTVTSSAPVITSQLNVTAPVNTPFTYKINTIDSPTSYSALGLPSGWTFDSSSGTISGTPASAGRAYIVIGATNTTGTGTAMLNLGFQEPLPPISAFYYDGAGFISQGKSELETAANGFSFSLTDGGSNVLEFESIRPSITNWVIDLSAPGYVPLVPGTYLAAGEFPSQASNVPGLNWDGNSRSNNKSTGTFVVLDVQYGSGSTVTSFAADVVQFDEDVGSSWNIGSIRYNSSIPITYPTPPVILSANATSSGSTAEALNGVVNPAGPPTTVYFQYGPTTDYGNVTPNQQLLAGVIGVPLSATLTGLQPSVVYHYQLVATSAWGTSTSADATFIPGSSAPVISGNSNLSGVQGEVFSYQILASNHPIAYSAKGLPPNLVLDSSTGFISGSVALPGSYSILLSATNAAGTGDAAMTLDIATPEPVIVSPSTALATVGTSFSYQISATNSPTFYSAIGLPAGLTLNANSGLISGSPTEIGSSEVTISASNSSGTGEAPLILNVTGPFPVITNGTSFTATVNTPLSFTILATNGPVSFDASGLPPGLTLNTSTGVITGTFTAIGSYSTSISATNEAGSGFSDLNFLINPPKPALTSTLSAAAAVGGSFSYTITGTNSPTSYSASGLPPGLVLNSTTGVISGAATASGTFNITISATNAGGTISAILVLTIAPTPPIISSLLTVAAALNAPFRYTITAVNNPTIFSAAGLPSGFTINTSTGVISGTPTSSGTANVLIGAANSAGAGSANLTINFQAPPAAASAFYYDGVGKVSGNGSALETTAGGFTFTATKNFQNGVSVSINGPNSISWQINAAASGSTPLVLGSYVAAAKYPTFTSGIPGFSWSGNYGFDNQVLAAFNVLDIQYGSGSTVTSFAADFVQFDELSTSAWNIGSIRYNSAVPITYAAPPVIVSTAATPLDLGSEMLGAAIDPAGPPTSVYFQYGPKNAYGSTTPPQDLAAGVTGVPITATLTGLQSSGNYHYRVVASNGWGTSMSADTTFATAVAKPVISGAANVQVTQGQPFSYQIQATNTPASYSASGLPSGFTLDQNAGLISGTVTQTGTYPVTLSAMNSVGTGTATLSIVVEPLPSFSPTTLPAAYAGSLYQQTVSVVGGAAPYASLSITNFDGGTTGLTTAAVTANLSGTVAVNGTPIATGTLSFTVNLTDGSGATANASYTLLVNPALAAPVLQPLPAFLAGTSCTIQWSTVSGAAQYDVQISSSPNFAAPLSSESVVNTTATFAGLENGQTCYYRVRADSGPPLNATSAWGSVTQATQVTYAPVLVITSPADGDFTTLGSVTVTGSATDVTSGIGSVTVNGVPATTANGFAQWTASAPLSSGENVVTVIALNNAGIETLASFTIKMLLDSEGKGVPDSWKAAHGLTGAAGAALADPYGTGYCNLLAYAFDIDPAIYPDPPPVNTSQMINSGDGLPYLALTYRRLIGAAQLSYQVEISNDLANWSSPAGQIVQVGVEPVGDEVGEWVTVLVGPPISQGGALYGRVRVSSP